MEPFEVQVEQLAGTVVIRPVGEADFATASTWRTQLLTALDGLRSDQLRVILDLTELSFMDSAGLQVLVIGYRHAIRGGVDCCIAGATPPIASRMNVAGLTPYIPGYPTLAEALDHG